jgi:2-oxoglutarate ferredoxin oxidoreductase subunit alpha
VDGDGIPWRTLPGISPKAAFFTRGSGHAKTGAYTEDSHEYQEVMDRLARKYATARALVPKALASGTGHEVGILSLGTCDGAVKEALQALAKDGLHLDYLRVRGFPFGEDVERWLEQHRTVFVVEQNRDAQLRSLLTLETRVPKDKLRSILHYNGLPIPSACIVEGVRAALRKPDGKGAAA